MTFQIITADERLAQKAGIKGLIIGKAGIGKTSLLYTLDPATTLFVNAEAGELSVQDWGGDMIRLRTWPDARNLAAAVGGGNPALDDAEPYSLAHAAAIRAEMDFTKYETVFVDSITEVSRICFGWSAKQPEAFSEKTGKPDTRGAYGLLGREMVNWLKQFQHAPRVNVWLVGLLNEVKDDFGRLTYVMQVEGSKTALEAPGVLDQVLTMTQFTPGCRKQQWRWRSDPEGDYRARDPHHPPRSHGRWRLAHAEQELALPVSRLRVHHYGRVVRAPQVLDADDGGPLYPERRKGCQDAWHHALEAARHP